MANNKWGCKSHRRNDALRPTSAELSHSERVAERLKQTEKLDVHRETTDPLYLYLSDLLGQLLTIAIWSDGAFVAGLLPETVRFLYNTAMLGCNYLQMGCDVDLSAFTGPPFNGNVSAYVATFNEKTDNDIDGLGVDIYTLWFSWYCLTCYQVLLAFLITASATLLIAWIRFLCYPVDTSDLDDSDSFGLNILDESFLKWVWATLPNRPVIPLLWIRISQKVVLMLSDQLIVTGFTALVAAYIKSCRISTYQFEIVTWMAWTASNTHQTTLTILRAYLRAHRSVLNYRVFAMTVIVIMLFVALWFAGRSTSELALLLTEFTNDVPYQSFYYAPILARPAACSWKGDDRKVDVDYGDGYYSPTAFSTNISNDIIFSLCLISFSYVSRICKLFITTSDFAEKWLRKIPGKWLDEKCDKSLERANRATSFISRAYWKFLASGIVGIYVWAKAIYDLYQSFISELLWLTLGLLWGIAKIFSWRREVDYANENAWGFGQLLALLFLILPVMILPELYSDAKESLNSPPASHLRPSGAPSKSSIIPHGASANTQANTTTPTSTTDNVDIPTAAADTAPTHSSEDDFTSPTRTDTEARIDSSPPKVTSPRPMQAKSAPATPGPKDLPLKLVPMTCHQDFYKSVWFRTLVAWDILSVFGFYLNTIVYQFHGFLDAGNIWLELPIRFVTWIAIVFGIWMWWMAMGVCFSSIWKSPETSSKSVRSSGG